MRSLIKYKYIPLLVFILPVLGLKGCPKKVPFHTDNDGVYRGKLYEDKKLTTPKGIQMVSKFAINPELAPLADLGIDDLLKVASAPPNNYDVSDMPHSRFKIWIFPRSSKCIEAAFLVVADGTPYDGTEYDKDPAPGKTLLCAAGMTVMQGLMADHPGMVVTDDKAMMRRIVRYEGEHSVLFYKDAQRYVDTQYHVGTDMGHPILGDGPPGLLDGSGMALKAVEVISPADFSPAEDIHVKAGDKFCVVLTH